MTFRMNIHRISGGGGGEGGGGGGGGGRGEGRERCHYFTHMYNNDSQYNTQCNARVEQPLVGA